MTREEFFQMITELLEKTGESTLKMIREPDNILEQLNEQNPKR